MRVGVLVGTFSDAGAPEEGAERRAAVGVLAEPSGHLTLPGLASSPGGAGLLGSANRQAGFSSSLSSQLTQGGCECASSVTSSSLRPHGQ